MFVFVFVFVFVFSNQLQSVNLWILETLTSLARKFVATMTIRMKIRTTIRTTMMAIREIDPEATK